MVSLTTIRFDSSDQNTLRLLEEIGFSKEELTDGKITQAEHPNLRLDILRFVFEPIELLQNLFQPSSWDKEIDIDPSGAALALKGLEQAKKEGLTDTQWEWWEMGQVESAGSMRIFISFHKKA